MDDIWNQLVGVLGIDPSLLAALIPLLVFGFNAIARAIPEDATGFPKLIRQIAKVLGIYVSSRVTSGVKVTDVAKIALDKATELDQIQTLLGDNVKAGNPVFRKQPGRDPETGKFTKIESPWFVSVIAIALILPLLSGCATVQTAMDTAKRVACQNPEKVQALIDVAQDALNQCPTNFAGTY